MKTNPDAQDIDLPRELYPESIEVLLAEARAINATFSVVGREKFQEIIDDVVSRKNVVLAFWPDMACPQRFAFSVIKGLATLNQIRATNEAVRARIGGIPCGSYEEAAALAHSLANAA